MVVDCTRDADPAWFCQCLQSCRYIDPVPEYVVLFNDHIAEIDPDAEPDPALFGHVRLTVDHPALDLDRTPDRVDHAGEFREQAVAGVLYDPAAVLGDLRVYQLAEMRFEARVRPLLVLAHQPGIADYISGKDCGEAAGRGHGLVQALCSKVRRLNGSTTRASRHVPDGPPRA